MTTLHPLPNITSLFHCPSPIVPLPSSLMPFSFPRASPSHLPHLFFITSSLPSLSSPLPSSLSSHLSSLVPLPSCLFPSQFFSSSSIFPVVNLPPTPVQLSFSLIPSSHPCTLSPILSSSLSLILIHPSCPFRLFFCKLPSILNPLFRSCLLISLP
jgi:hypothetical protein